MTIDVLDDIQQRILPEQMRDKRNDAMRDDAMRNFVELTKQDQQKAIEDRDPIDVPLPEN